MKITRLSERIPFAIPGQTIEEFMADKECYAMECASLAEDGGKFLWVDALVWDKGKVKYVRFEPD